MLRLHVPEDLIRLRPCALRFERRSDETTSGGAPGVPRRAGGGDRTVWLGSRGSISLVTAKAGPVPVRRVGQAMPDFELVDLQGRPWRLADLKGKTAFVNVWATWCAPCRKEMPHLQRLYERVKDRPDVVLLTMNVDEKVAEVQLFVTRTATPSR